MIWEIFTEVIILRIKIGMFIIFIRSCSKLKAQGKSSHVATILILYNNGIFKILKFIIENNHKNI